MNRKQVAALVGAATLAVTFPLSGCAAGGDGAFPDDTITLIVPYPAGSAPDAGARIIATQLESDLDVSVVVENNEAGASTVGMNEVAESEPDGYTLGWGAATGVTVQPRIIDTPFEGVDALTPIAQVNAVPNVLYSNPDKGWETIDEFIAAAKEDELTVGLPQPGSAQHLQVAMLEQEAGIDLEEVHFDAGEMTLPAVNGTTDCSVSQPGPAVQYVDKGDLNFVGAFGEVPDGLEVDSFDDAGFDTSAMASWEGVFGPKGMPDDVVNTLSDAIGTAVESEEYQRFIGEAYGIPASLPADEFADVVKKTDDAGATMVEDLELAS